MKRLYGCLIATALFCVPAFSQNVSSHFGVQGGVTINSLTFSNKSSEKALVGWHAGATCLLKLPAYFSLQPTVQYERSTVRLPDASTFNENLIGIPFPIQWGPDLGLLRIFAEAVPFVNFSLGGKCGDVYTKEITDLVQLGVGVGGGLEIWKIQIRARYNWEFVDLGKYNDYHSFGIRGKRGVTVTLAIFFN